MSTRTKVTKAEALARYHDKYAGWGDLRNHDMQKEAAALLRRQEDLLRRALEAMPPTMKYLLADITDLLQETEDAE